MTMIISGSDGLEFPDGSDQGTAFTGNAATITSGTIATARLATGTANSSTYLRGDQTWAAVPAATPGGSTTQVQYNNAGAFGGSANLVWDNTNARLGIGTASPATRLHVTSSTAVQVRIEATGSSAGFQAFTNAGVNTVGALDFTSSAMIFYTGIGSASAAERMRIDSSGNVGIGTASPSRNLSITSSGNTTLQVTNSTAGTASSDGFIVQQNGLNTFLLNQEAGILYLGTSNTERVAITAGGDLQFNSGYGSVATAYGCRAWVNFNGTSTVSIRASGNVTSITDNGTGLYQINFTTAMPDANYAVTVSGAGERDGSGGNSVFNIRAPSTNFVGSSSLATSSVQISQKTVGGGLADSDVVTVSVFR
jgi:hypothetical protein